MRRLLVATGCLAGMLVMTSCAGDSENSEFGPEKDSDDVSVEAQRDVMLSNSPLGDVITGDLAQGDEATALCFVPRARSSGGFVGSAVKIDAGGDTGYAPVTDFPSDSAERQMIFNLDQDALRTGLPECPE